MTATLLKLVIKTLNTLKHKIIFSNFVFFQTRAESNNGDILPLYSLPPLPHIHCYQSHIILHDYIMFFLTAHDFLPFILDSGLYYACACHFSLSWSNRLAFDEDPSLFSEKRSSPLCSEYVATERRAIVNCIFIEVTLISCGWKLFKVINWDQLRFFKVINLISVFTGGAARYSWSDADANADFACFSFNLVLHLMPRSVRPQFHHFW